ncbi:MAG: hypothetical protein IJJ33_03480, partial [Victivallales bacterium]|nr:hypothetical protein [Victivallales bacterium]
MPSLTDYARDFPTVVARLHQARANGRVGQAYLFVGDDIGFLEGFAKAWSQTAACLSPHPDGSSCGNCDNCRRLERDTYPEMYIVRPQSKSRQITAEQMLNFEHSISLTTAGQALKIGMLVEAERLNTASQNAFLKTLEEPPAGTLLILLTVNARMLLPTTKSRCQTISLLRNRLDYSEVAKLGLFQHLALLHRQAGAAAGLRASAGISSILAGLHAQAESSVDDSAEKSWAEAGDAQMRRLAAEERVAKVESEYVRLRGMVTDAIQTWFLQRLLIASGVPREQLPCADLLPATELPIPKPEEASRDIQLAEEFLQCLAANVDEKLALDS